MGKKGRLSGEERRESILRAVGAVFAENGFRGTTTKALAEAAGISEALLFKHFPSKEALYAAVQASFTGAQGPDRFGGLASLEPSTATLVRIVHTFYVSLLPPEGLDASSNQAVLARLMFRSVTEDGEFARSFLRRVGTGLVAKVEECILTSAMSGDLEEGGGLVNPRLAGWFSHHLIVMLLLSHLSRPPIVDYGATPSTVVEQAVRFALRGMGLKGEAIRRHYRPEEWSRTAR
jgi:AcrR family transcriptional regulator